MFQRSGGSSGASIDDRTSPVGGQMAKVSIRTHVGAVATSIFARLFCDRNRIQKSRYISVVAES